MVSLKVPNGLNFAKLLTLNITFFFIPLLLIDFGFDGLQIGILMSIYTVVSIVSSFPIGIINDRLSIKYVIITGMVLESIHFAGLYAFRDFYVIMLFFIAGGIGGNMVDSSIRSLTFKLAESGRKGRRLGFYQLIGSFGAGTGVLLGGLLLYSINFSGALLLSAVAFLAMAVFSFFVADAGSASFPIQDYRKVIMRKGALPFLIPLFIFGMHWGAEHTSYALFLRESLGLDLVTSGLYMGIPIMILAVSSFYGGRFIDRTGKHRGIMFAGFLISGLGHILMTIDVVYISFAFRVFHEIGDGLAVIGYFVIFSKLFKTDRIAGESGIAHSLMNMGAAFGAFVFGPLGYAYGFSWPLIVSGALSIACIFVLFPLRKRLEF